MTPVYAITDIYKRFASNHKIGYNATIVNTVLDYWGSHKNELGLFYAGKKHNNPEYEEMISMDVFQIRQRQRAWQLQPSSLFLAKEYTL